MHVGFPLTVPAPEPGAAGADKIRGAARDFEALLITLMLKTMREASGSQGWLEAREDHSNSPIMELAEQQLAQALAASGGLGLARLAEEGITRGDSRANSSR